MYEILRGEILGTTPTDGSTAHPPNFLLLITDQQRYPCHWPEDPAWLRDLTPNDHDLAATGLTFRQAFCNTSMCSPSRATLLTGRYPAQHGVTLTHTQADLRPDPANSPAVVAALLGMLSGPNAPRARALRGFGRGLLQLGPKSGNEPELRPETPSLARVLRERGYEVAYKGKWHLTHPGGDGPLLAGWAESDAERLRRDYGFADWEPPDAGENAKAEHFGAGNAGPLGKGWDEVYTQQVESWLGRADLPEPFCLVVSLVNPDDVLGYPAQHRQGGDDASEFRDVGVALPRTLGEDLRDKPTVHELMKMGMAAYLGPLRSERAKLDYVNFYAYLHRVVDEKIGRVMAALGDPGVPRVAALAHTDGPLRRSRGDGPLTRRPAAEGLQRLRGNDPHPAGGLQPRPLPEAGGDRCAGLARRRHADDREHRGSAARRRGQGPRPSPIIAARATPARERLPKTAADFSSLTEHGAPAGSVQDQIHFTYDDHQAATALQDVPGQPNRIRAIRTADAKFALYFDPAGRASPEYEMYDLGRDPLESRNLVARDDGEPRATTNRALRSELGERLRGLMAANGTGPVPSSGAEPRLSPPRFIREAAGSKPAAPSGGLLRPTGLS